MTRLTILGSGTAVPSGERFPAGYLLATPAARLMVDCGPGTLRRLAQAGTTLDQLDAVLLTHYHTDHCADLAALLFALRAPRYAGRRPLHVLGAPGLQRLVDKLTEAWPWLQPRGYELVLRELTPGTFALADAEVTAVPIRHTAQSLGYRITAGDGTIAFTGDADECEELVELARTAHTLVCEASTPDGQKLDGHLTPALAAGYATRAGVTRLVLTHFYPECEGHDLRAAAARHFAGDIVLAEDLAVHTVGAD